MSGVLLYGGSFDPIHHGHLIASRAVAERLGIGRVILIPSAAPPHKRHVRLTPAADRVEMCRLALDGDALFEVSDWETRQAGPNYTLLTVEHFRADGMLNVHWLIGMDSLHELDTWYRVGELADRCTIVTAARPGYPSPDLTHLAGKLTAEQIERIRRHILDTPPIDVRATDIRQRVARGQSIQYLVPEAVRAYIRARGLYRAE